MEKDRYFNCLHFKHLKKACLFVSLFTFDSGAVCLLYFRTVSTRTVVHVLSRIKYRYHDASSVAD
jgi:hypothetical protein